MMSECCRLFSLPPKFEFRVLQGREKAICPKYGENPPDKPLYYNQNTIEIILWNRKIKLTIKNNNNCDNDILAIL